MQTRVRDIALADRWQAAREGHMQASQAMDARGGSGDIIDFLEAASGSTSSASRQPVTPDK